MCIRDSVGTASLTPSVIRVELPNIVAIYGFLNGYLYSPNRLENTSINSAPIIFFIFSSKQHIIVILLQLLKFFNSLVDFISSFFDFYNNIISMLNVTALNYKGNLLHIDS